MKVVDISQRQFLILNGVIVTLIVASFFWTRKGQRAPLTLHFKNQAPKASETLLEKRPALNGKSNDEEPGQGPSQAPLNQRNSSGKSWENRYKNKVVPEDDPPVREKPLNVMFNWNGHSWDAYEVLGLPAGSSPEAVIAAFQQIASKSDQDSIPFLKAAYEAIIGQSES